MVVEHCCSFLTKDNHQFTLWCYKLIWHFKSSEWYGENEINSHENQPWFETLGREFCWLIELESVCAALSYQLLSFSFIDRSFAYVVSRRWTWDPTSFLILFSAVQSPVFFHFSSIRYLMKQFSTFPQTQPGKFLWGCKGLLGLAPSLLLFIWVKIKYSYFLYTYRYIYLCI